MIVFPPSTSVCGINFGRHEFGEHIFNLIKIVTAAPQIPCPVPPQPGNCAQSDRLPYEVAHCGTRRHAEATGDLVDMPANVAITEQEVTLRFHRRAHLPIVLASDLFNKSLAVPWWKKLPLRFVQ
jgi:hypothetical protein